MSDSLVLSIAEKFSAYPAGRDDNDGDFNGQKFRRNFLVPLLKQAEGSHTKVTVSLRGMKSFGSSFLEEAFGGLVRNEGFKKSTLASILVIDAGAPENERYKDSIERYIERAR
jgi:STAS-like domain of unknown function (DUF4325)